MFLKWIKQLFSKRRSPPADPYGPRGIFGLPVSVEKRRLLRKERPEEWRKICRRILVIVDLKSKNE